MDFHALAVDAFWLLLVCLGCGFVFYLVDLAPVDATFKQIAKGVVIFLLIVIVVIFVGQIFGLTDIGGGPLRNVR